MTTRTRRDPINYPTRNTMLTLVGLMIGHTLEIINGQLTIRFRCDSSVMVAVEDDALTELERREWCVIHDDEGGITVTDRGCYWARRWSESHLEDVQEGRSGPKLMAAMVARAGKAVRA